jgi:hypothetical protein
MSTPKDGETRRDVMIRGAVGAAAAATVGTQAQAQATTPRIIRAVAVGTEAVGTTHDRVISAQGQIPSYARPYISGLVTWLALTSNQKTQPRETDVGRYVLGTGATNNYTIEYRERPVASLASAFDGVSSDSGHLLFCMSTSVGDAAINFMDLNSITVPMVVISSHFDNFEQSHVCVVSAERPQLIRPCFNRFKHRAPSGTRFHALHRQDHVPSTDALRRLGPNQVEFINPVKDNENPADVVNNITIPTGETHGLLVLPADRFFAAADDIISRATAKGMMTFWTTSDENWPAGANGGYGYKQEVCGRYMAERVGRVWDRGGVPPDKDKRIPRNEVSEKTWTP